MSEEDKKQSGLMGETEKYDRDKRSKAAEAAAVRIFGKEAAKSFLFVEEEERKDGFLVEGKEGRIEVKAADPVSFLCGIHWYLKRICRMAVTWETAFPLQLPDPLPTEFAPIQAESPYRYRYFLNYCTFSYTAVFWDWERWEKELDRMAMGGINLALCLVGQECIVRDMLLEAGMEREDVEAYLVSPTYLAWFFMGNMASYGTRMPEAWYGDRIVLARRIHKRMGELGITPVFPGFYGIVPRSIQKKYPSARLIGQGNWCGMERPPYLSESDPLFTQLSDCYYRKEKEYFGDVTHFFAAEPFHEGGMRGGVSIKDYGKAVFDGMRRAYADAVWVIQAWDKNPPLALFEKVDRQSVLILNLLAGRVQGYEQITEGFGGIPWIYCPVHNYGGRNGMYGFLRTLAREPAQIRKKETSMCGIGLAPEALGTNPVFYDLFWDLTYRRDAVDIHAWLDDFVERRYGGGIKDMAAAEAVLAKLKKAWHLLEDSVYNSFVPQPGGAESFFCARPGFRVASVSTWGPKQIAYDMAFVREAGRLFYGELDVLWDWDAYRYDLTDVMRQCLSGESRILYGRLMYQLEQGKQESFLQSAKQFLELIQAQDAVLFGHEAFSMAAFLRQAADCGRDYGMEKTFEAMAKRLVTLWGGKNNEVLHDYSAREWSGIMGGFYYERWKRFFTHVAEQFEAYQNRDLGNGVSRDWEGGKDGNPAKELHWYEWEERYLDKGDWKDNARRMDGRKALAMAYLSLFPPGDPSDIPPESFLRKI